MRNGALWVTFNRPQAMNSLTEGIIETLEWALDQIDENPDLRALVVTGTGRAFCAGADLSIGGGSDGDEGEGTGQYRAMLERALKLFSRLDNAKRPTIAALNGITLAGGLEIALACDIIVAAASAKIGDGHVKFGQLPAGGGTVRLPRRVGASFAKYLMFTGAVLTAEEALAASLVEKVAPDEQLQDTVDEIVAAVGAASPIGVSLMKELVHAGLSLGPEQALDNELSVAVEYSKSEDRKEGLAAFRERRAPVFIGR
ncbi:enoyl-CoA hydratase/isomerase family protein [Streptomyces sp. NPDC002623]